MTVAHTVHCPSVFVSSAAQSVALRRLHGARHVFGITPWSHNASNKTPGLQQTTPSFFVVIQFKRFSSSNVREHQVGMFAQPRRRQSVGWASDPQDRLVAFQSATHPPHRQEAVKIPFHHNTPLTNEGASSSAQSILELEAQRPNIKPNLTARLPLGTDAVGDVAATQQQLMTRQGQILRKCWSCRVCHLQFSSASNRTRHERAKHSSFDASRSAAGPISRGIFEPVLDSSQESEQILDLPPPADWKERPIQRSLERVPTITVPTSSPKLKRKIGIVSANAAEQDLEPEMLSSANKRSRQTTTIMTSTMTMTTATAGSANWSCSSYCANGRGVVYGREHEWQEMDCLTHGIAE